jgi:glucose-1-phosphate thymidylyltransferase
MAFKGVIVVPEVSGTRSREGAAGTQLVANRPIVCHVVDALDAAGASQIALVGAPEALEEIQGGIEADGSGDVAYLPCSRRSGLLGALAAAAPFVGEAECVVHSSAGLVGQPLGPLAATLGRGQSDLLLLLHRTSGLSPGLDPRTERLLGISQLEPSRTRLGLAQAGMFGRRALRDACASLHEEPDAGDFGALAVAIAQTGGQVRAGFVREWHAYAGRPVELLELNRIVLDQQMPDGERCDDGDNRIEGRVVIHPSAEISSSVILGPSIIGPGARVINAYIGPYTSVGAATWIEGAEIERSIILDGAKVMHVGGRIEASTVGCRAKIVRDFALPRALRLHVGEAVEVMLS